MLSTATFLDRLKIYGSMPRWLAAPRWLRRAWGLNVAVSPPLFWSEYALFFFYWERSGTHVFILTMASAALGTRLFSNWTLVHHIGLAFTVGALHGVLAAWYFGRRRREFGLPPWGDFLAACDPPRG